MNRVPQELEAKVAAEIEAVVRATYGAHYEPLIDQKRREIEAQHQELKALELEYSQAVEDYVGRLRGETPRNGSFQVPTPENDGVNSPQENHASQNGSIKLPTRRAMLLTVLREFNNDFFKRRDADAKIIERWPEAEPTTPVERKTFAAANAGFLNDLVREGKLEARKGEGRFDPTEYRVVDNDEDTLLRSGP